jgi:hypothetical protein
MPSDGVLDTRAVCPSVGAAASAGIVDLVHDWVTRILGAPGHLVVMSKVLHGGRVGSLVLDRSGHGDTAVYLENGGK